MRERLFIGLAAGAACDGVDAAVVRVRNRRGRMKAEQIHHVHCPHETALRDRLESCCLGGAKSPLWRPGRAGSLVAAAGSLAALDRDMGLAFADAAEAVLRDAGTPRDDILAVGASGQWITRWAGETVTGAGGLWLAGSPAVIAERTRLPVVAGFACCDVAAGGCGVPMTAWPTWRLLRDRRLSRVAVHLGGLATLTFVGSGALAGDVTAFDVGPGTLVIDQVCREYLGEDLDVDGSAAARGRVCAELLGELLSHPYFLRRGPKSANPADWGRDYIDRLSLTARKHGCAGRDLVATVTELTAQTVHRAISALTERPHEVVLSGGGALNIHLAGRIRSLLSPSSTYTIDRYGPSLRGKQAVCLAMLAAARLDKFPAHCPAATGARREAVLGSVTLG